MAAGWFCEKSGGIEKKRISTGEDFYPDRIVKKVDFIRFIQLGLHIIWF
jgi:hypothetical protein